MSPYVEFELPAHTWAGGQPGQPGAARQRDARRLRKLPEAVRQRRHAGEQFR